MFGIIASKQTTRRISTAMTAMRRLWRSIIRNHGEEEKDVGRPVPAHERGRLNCYRSLPNEEVDERMHFDADEFFDIVLRKSESQGTG